MNRAIAIFATLTFCVLLSGCTQNQSQENAIHVAIVSSETGDLAEIGKDMSRGAMLAFDEANAQGGVLGKEIVYEVFDDQGDPKTAVTVARKVCQDQRFIAVVGHLTSGCMSAAAPVYPPEQMPVAMPVPTNPKITEQGFDTLFRIPPTDDDQAPFVARFLGRYDSGAPVAVVNDLTAYGTGFAQAFKETFDGLGGNIVAYEGIQKTARDFRTLITKLKALSPKYVVLGATYDMGAPFVRQMQELGLKATVVAGDGMFGSEFIAQAGTAAEGSIVSFIAPPSDSSEKTKAFFDAFGAKYGKVVSFAPLGYDAATVVIEALKRSHSTSRTGLLDALKSPDFEVEGITGKIKFETNGNNAHKNLTLYTVKNGGFVLFTPDH